MSGDLYQYFLAPDGEGAGYTLPYGTHRVPWCAEGRPLEHIMGHHLLDYNVGYHYPTSIIPRHTRCGLTG